MDGYERIGEIDVDAGCAWIGDPCYIIRDDDERRPFPDWQTFCRKLDAAKHDEQRYTSFAHDGSPVNGETSEGMGMVISTGYGDGTYPVYAKRDRGGRILEVRVLFDDQDADDEDDWNDEEDE